MNSNLCKFGLNFIITILKNSNLLLRLSLKSKKNDEFKIGDKEIKNMINDPKFANIASDLDKLKSSREEMEKAGAELKSMGVDISKKDSYNKNDLDSLLNNLLPTGGLDNSLKLDLEKPKWKTNINHSLGNSDDLLIKLGDFKEFNELGLDIGNNSKLDLATTNSKSSSIDEEKKNKKEEKSIKKPEEDEFKNFDFLTKQQARLLLEILKQPVFFGMLPDEAQRTVKVMEKKYLWNIFNKFLMSS